MSTEKKQLYEQLSRLETEQRNPATMHVDLAEPREIVRLMSREDQEVAACVESRSARIAEAIELGRLSLARGGRLIYCGAGTSGRIGVVDAAECPPTFGTRPEQVVGLIAGGPEAMFRAQEGSEDRPENGVRDIAELDVTQADTVCGLAASGRTPYVLGCLEEAGRRGAGTIMVCCVPREQVDLRPAPDILIDIPVGPEVIMGSTRLKSATAQKMVCNMITTGIMIRLGKVYENVMVDLMLTNRKLEERARRIVSMFTGHDYEKSSDLLHKAGGNVKIALVMGLADMDADGAVKLLEAHHGFIRAALKSIGKG
ncbi:N-acetylmuramic acid 6-phosphate etherase [Balneolales bacterium ANBcel1]|nr:N-acetylmuramic acid 6-phosphate etherase [Balneolales bacterium ANBcel1]